MPARDRRTMNRRCPHFTSRHRSRFRAMRAPSCPDVVVLSGSDRRQDARCCRGHNSGLTLLHAANPRMRMKYRMVIFDFDGTLADSFPFFALTFNELADAHGFRRVDAAEASAMRELGAREIMREVGLPAWKLPRVARDFTARMQASAASVSLFAGIDAALSHLSRQGVALAIVSSNAQSTICRILGPANTALIGDFECGMSMFGKAARLRSLLRRARMPGHQSLYVGDQSTDLEAARAAGMAAGAVGWGYASIASLRALHPEESFETVQELHRLAEP